MKAAYGILAGPLALFYLYGGGLKTVRSREALRPMMAWVDDLPMAAVRAIGAVEVLGALGLVLPPLTGIAPWLAAVAATGFVLLQLGAIRVHLRMGDRQLGLNVGLLVVAVAIIPLAPVS
ncbi:DoxX family protein [Streptomyces sp. NPDC021562]|uniref:DoxX family protein n=1 Tax=Streptomyces sp. NPDC021562 TaxID=3155121 RepID=UPI0033FF0740